MNNSGAISSNNPNYDAYGPIQMSGDEHAAGSAASNVPFAATMQPYPSGVSPVSGQSLWQKNDAPQNWDFGVAYFPGDRVCYDGNIYQVPADARYSFGVTPGTDDAKWSWIGTVGQHDDFSVNQPPRPPGNGGANPPPASEPSRLPDLTLSQGLPGKDGKDGSNGKDGKPGEPARFSAKDKLGMAAIAFVAGLLGGKTAGTIGWFKDKIHDFVHQFRSNVPDASQADEEQVDQHLDAWMDNAEVVYGQPATYETSVWNGGSGTFTPVRPNPPPYGVLQTGSNNSGWQFAAGAGQWGYAPPTQAGNVH